MDLTLLVGFRRCTFSTLLQIVSVPGEGGDAISVVSEGLAEMSDLRFWYGISAHDSAMLMPFTCSC